jgi:hypothetical protein
MSPHNEPPAAEVFAIIEEPTAQMGRVMTFFLKILAPFGGQLIPGRTHPVVVEKASGKKVKGSAAGGTAMIESMRADLWTMTAGEFRNRYLDI